MPCILSKLRRTVLILAWFVAIQCHSLAAVPLAWDPSPDANVLGYAIYYGTNSGNYQTRVPVGNATNTVLSNLTNVGTYYFVAVAYTAEGVESLPSNEVSYTVNSGTPPITPLVTIVTPDPATTLVTTNSTVNLAGLATDDLGVTLVRWTNRCNQASGIASGTANWSANALPLCVGTNQITVTALDGQGNSDSAELTVVRFVPIVCTASLNFSNWSVAAAGNSTNVVLNLPGGCAWSVTSPCPWLSVLPSAGTGSMTLQLNASANPTTNARACTLSIAGQSFALSQAALVAPVVALTSHPTNGFTFTTNAQVSVTGTAFSAAGLAQVAWSNSCTVASGLASGTTNWTVANLPLCLGTNLITLTARDSLNNAGTVVTRIVRQAPLLCAPQLNLTNANVAATGGSVPVIVSVNAGCDWAVTSPCPWLTVFPATGSGTATVTITAAANSTTNARACTLSIAGQTFTLSQPALVAPVVTLTSHPTNGLTFTTNTQANVTGTAFSTAGLAQVAWSNNCTAASGLASGTTNWTVANLPLCLGTNLITLTARDSFNNIGTSVVRIVRGASLVCAAALNLTNANVSAAGGSVAVAVNVAAGCSWTVTSPCLWLAVFPVSGSGSATVTITVAANSSTNARACTLSIAGQTFTLSQPAHVAPVVTLTSHPTNTLTFTTNTQVSVTGTALSAAGLAQVAWSNSCTAASGLASGTTNWNVANLPLCLGTNLITLTARDSFNNVGTVVTRIVREAPLVCAAALNLSNANVAAPGGSMPVTVTIAAGCSWTVTSPCPWLTVFPVSGTGSGTVTLTAAANSTTNARACTLSIAGQTFALSQAALVAPVVALTSHPTNGFTFTTNTQANVTGTAFSTAGLAQVAWSNSCTTATGLAIGTTNWTVANLPLCLGTNLVTLTARDSFNNVGTVVTRIVREAPLVCAPQLNLTNANVAATGSSVPVIVTVNAGCDWAVTSPCSWLSVFPVSGNGSGIVTLTAAANPTTNARACTLWIAGQTFTLSQAGEVGATLSLERLSAAPTSGSYCVAVSAPSNFVWVATSESDWLQITSASVNAGSGNVCFTAMENSNCLPRSATLTVAGRSVHVSQNARAPGAFKRSTFNGLFTDSLSQSNSGSFTLKTTSSGAFSGKVALADGRWSFKGLFGTNRYAFVTIPRLNRSPLTLQLGLESCDATEVSGVVTDGNSIAGLRAYRNVFNTVSNPCTYAGKYTMVIPANLTNTSSPPGHGFGTVKVSSNGVMKITGVLGDGSKISMGGWLTEHGEFPLFVSLYRRSGSILGWLSVVDDPASGAPHGNLAWTKPAKFADRFYAGGFTNSVAAVGSYYLPPASFSDYVVGFTNAFVHLHGGNFINNVSRAATLLPGNGAAVALPTDLTSGSMSLKIQASQGLFRGTVFLPLHSRTIKYQGAFLQNFNAGYGYFAGTNETGQVSFGPVN